MSYFLLGPQCGPILGPVVGGALAGGPSWRWIFGFLAMLAAALWLAILLLLPETLRARVGNGRVVADRWLVWPLRASSPRAPEPERGPPPPKPSLAGYWRLFAYPPIGI
ncbi:Dityrosine transporter 1, partial [Ophidiomyces ophidiicola]